jgi:hypothetical protein
MSAVVITFLERSFIDCTNIEALLKHSNSLPVVRTVHRPGDDPRKECEECGNARGSNVRYYPT